jgi:hypothetical protein
MLPQDFARKRDGKFRHRPLRRLIALSFWRRLQFSASFASIACQARVCARIEWMVRTASLEAAEVP